MDVSASRNVPVTVSFEKVTVDSVRFSARQGKVYLSCSFDGSAQIPTQSSLVQWGAAEEFVLASAKSGSTYTGSVRVLGYGKIYFNIPVIETAKS